MTDFPEKINISPVHRQKRDDDFYLVDRAAFPGKGTEYVRADVAAAMVKAERERCAEIARTHFATGDATPGAIPPDDQIAGEAIAAAIMEGQGDD